MLDAPDGPPPSSVEPLVVPDTDKTDVQKVKEAVETITKASEDDIKGAAEKIGEEKVQKLEGTALATEPGAQEDPVPIPTPEQNIKDIVDRFGVVKPSPDQPEATMDDIKVMMVRAGNMVWPDDKAKCRKQGCEDKAHKHEKFKAADAKSMIKSLYGVESSKELRRPQVDFLYSEFGKILSGHAFLDRDGQGTVYIATPMGVSEEEVRRNVLTYAK
jgi:hypothetical protein